MRSNRPIKDVPRTVDEAWKVINSLLDEWFGEQIEEIVKKTQEPTLRPKLRLLFFERTRFQIAIEQANDLSALESAIDESAATLDERIRTHRKQLERAAEIKKAETRKQFAARNLEALHLLKELKESVPSRSDVSSSDARVAIHAVEAAERATAQVLQVSDRVVSTSDRVEDVLLDVDRRMLTKDLVRFRRGRILRKWLRHLYVFFWGVLILGFLLGMLISKSAQLFIVNYWWLGLLGIGWAVAKHYWLSPWFRRRTLETQRKHLLKSLHDFYAANIQVTVLVAMKEKRNDRKNYRKRIRARKK